MTFLLGFALGAAAGWLTFRFWPRKKVAAVMTPKKEWKTYGHPKPPVPSLLAKLPDAPTGHAWEVCVKHDEKGTPWLHLSLLNLSTGEPVEQTRKNLVRGGYPWDTWAAYYRNWSSADSRNRAFNDKLLGPMVDWASPLVDKYTNANAVGDYVIGDGA